MSENLPVAVTEYLPLSPQEIVTSAKAAAQVLVSTVDNTSMVVVLKREGKSAKYLRLEAWGILGTFARSFYGGVVAPKTFDAEPITNEDGKVIGYKARAEAICNGQALAGAEAMVMLTEKQWGGKPAFQVASMAQTRAASKAMRNALGWIVALASKSEYRTTPAEEMESEPHEETSSRTERPSDLHTDYATRLSEAATVDDLKSVWAGIIADKPKLTEAEYVDLRASKDARKAELTKS